MAHHWWLLLLVGLFVGAAFRPNGVGVGGGQQVPRGRGDGVSIRHLVGFVDIGDVGPGTISPLGAVRSLGAGSNFVFVACDVIGLSDAERPFKPDGGGVSASQVWSVALRPCAAHGKVARVGK